MTITTEQPYLPREEFEKHIEHLRLQEVVAVDTEGTLTHPHSRTWGLSTSAQGIGDYYGFNNSVFPFQNLPAEWLPQLVENLHSKTLVMHHAKHDLRALRNLGLDFRGRFYCTMLMGHLINENRWNQGLDSLSKSYGGEPKRDEEAMQKLIAAFGWDYIPIEILRDYGFNDAYITEQLYLSMLPDFQNQGFDGEYWNTEQDFVRLLADMEDTGIQINQPLARVELTRGQQIMAEIKKDLGFNPGSPIELGNFLIGELSLPVLKRSKKTNKPSFDKSVMEAYDEVLAQMDDKRARQILIYRGWQKTTSSNYRPYLELVGPDGRLRPNFKQHGTKTGRLSCEHPNLQQIPRKSSNDWNGSLKKAFVPRNGYSLWEADYSQLEFRLAAAYAKQQNLIEIFADDKRDVFTEMATELSLPRDKTKTLNYSVQYGAGETRISDVFGVSKLAARAIISRYYSRYPGLKRFTDLAERRASDNGFVQLWTGRRRHFMYPSEYHKAANAVIQGGAFEIVKRRSLALRQAGLFSDDCRPVLQVHDSLVFEIRQGRETDHLPEIKQTMESVVPDFGVKFKVDMHPWGE